MCIKSIRNSGGHHQFSRCQGSCNHFDSNAGISFCLASQLEPCRTAKIRIGTPDTVSCWSHMHVTVYSTYIHIRNSVQGRHDFSAIWALSSVSALEFRRGNECLNQNNHFRDSIRETCKSDALGVGESHWRCHTVWCDVASCNCIQRFAICLRRVGIDLLCQANRQWVYGAVAFFPPRSVLVIPGIS